MNDKPQRQPLSRAVRTLFLMAIPGSLALLAVLITQWFVSDPHAAHLLRLGEVFAASYMLTVYTIIIIAQRQKW